MQFDKTAFKTNLLNIFRTRIELLKHSDSVMTLELQNTAIWFPAWTSFELSYIHWSQTNGLTTSAGISNQWTIWPPTCKINYVNMRNNYVHMGGGGYASITSQLCIIAPSYYNLTIKTVWRAYNYVPYVLNLTYELLSVQNIWRPAQKYLL